MMCAHTQSIRCECPDGYTGEDCATRINYCENSPCLNNGNCINQMYNYTCNCPMLFTGRNCETGKLKLEYRKNFNVNENTLLRSFILSQ